MKMNVQPFPFDRVFTHGPENDGASSSDLMLELATVRTELELLKSEAEAREMQARNEGFEAGMAHARTERETALLSAVDAMQAGIEALDGRYADAQDALTGDATQVALAAAELLAARTLEAAPGQAVDDAIGRTLRQVARGTEIQVRVHPDLAEDMETRLAARQAADRRRLNVTIIADHQIAMGDAEILWDQGGLTLDAAERRAQILSELETLLPVATVRAPAVDIIAEEQGAERF
ncbi:FliH/SctL family protein [Stakelama tenebrarum]|uniref:Flagellar assembly protein FliH n=1 Tax=Stakelama tenebrarum TaxID=2711215 RepID=A0A6G6Y456_9SPHN|nr:FliH/SctL family protein [Sphingosinithalassobacter tenebrarum]QIG79690.1 flagellar assembly protein FliH [Sphingosinithalassobacter tenebrarum]